jgi:hypothetical protein
MCEKCKVDERCSITLTPLSIHGRGKKIVGGNEDLESFVFRGFENPLHVLDSIVLPDTITMQTSPSSRRTGKRFSITRAPAYGLVFVQSGPDPNPTAPAMVEGARSVGMPTFDSNNGAMMEGDGGASILDLCVRSSGAIDCCTMISGKQRDGCWTP